MKKKPIKEMRPKAKNPKGFKDYIGYEVKARSEMLNSISDVYFKYGFDPLETPSVETVEALGKFLPDVDRPNEGVFSWQDEEEEWLALRYDLTAPLARFYAQFRNNLPTPYRRYAMGPVWRNEKPGPGRYKQFYQCDADSVGVPNVNADAEICMMLAEILEHIGINAGNYVIKLNNRKILNGVMEKIGLIDQNSLNTNLIQRGVVLRAIDKFDRLGEKAVKELLGKGRKDASGDFTDGAKLSPDQCEIIIGFLKSKGDSNGDTCNNLRAIVGDSKVGKEGIDELEAICNLAVLGGFNEHVLLIDPSVVRGLGYYTGPVFEAELTYTILDKNGVKRQYGSVAGGGRYDDLIKRFTGQSVPATGLSIGVDRLLAVLEETKKTSFKDKGPILVTVMDKELENYYQSILRELREANLRAEMFLGNPKDMGKQLRYADQRNSPIAVIVGSNEMSRDVVQLKDLELGARLSKEIETNEEWKLRPSQIEVNRADLLIEVRKMLGL